MAGELVTHGDRSTDVATHGGDGSGHGVDGHGANGHGADGHGGGQLATATWHPEVLNGPLTTRGLLRVDEAMRIADNSTGLTFSVYIGPLTDPVRDDAQAMHARLDDPDRTVFIALSPNQRVLEIVTGAVARRRILDRDSKLAALSMVAAFGGGDLAGGIVAGLAQLAEHAGRPAR